MTTGRINQVAALAGTAGGPKAHRTAPLDRRGGECSQYSCRRQPRRTVVVSSVALLTVSPELTAIRMPPGPRAGASRSQNHRAVVPTPSGSKAAQAQSVPRQSR